MDWWVSEGPNHETDWVVAVGGAQPGLSQYPSLVRIYDHLDRDCEGSPEYTRSSDREDKIVFSNNSYDATLMPVNVINGVSP